MYANLIAPLPLIRSESSSPLYPLVSPFVLGHELEGKPSLYWKSYPVHLVGHEDVVIDDMRERQ